MLNLRIEGGIRENIKNEVGRRKEGERRKKESHR